MPLAKPLPQLVASILRSNAAIDDEPGAGSYDWCTAQRDELSEKRSAAARAMFDKHEAEQRAAAVNRP